jgi:UDP-glucose 4-epimerase
MGHGVFLERRTLLEPRKRPASPRIDPGLRALVTGGAGFIGSHLVERLVAEGCKSVTVLDNLSRGRKANLAAVWQAIRFFEADIRNQPDVATIIRKTDVVFHLAAQSNVLGAVEDVDYASSTNVIGTAAVLQQARASGVRRVVFTSSREVYGDTAALPVSETAPLRPKNAYGMSKVAGEMCCAMSTRAPEVVILRLANVYGPRDSGRVIPLFIDNALSGRPLVLYGGKQTIDFVHVDDAVDALLAAAFGEHVACPVNVGSGTGTTIAELAERILKLTNSKSAISWQASRDVEVTHFVADNTRSRKLFGLEYRKDALQGLPELIARTAAESQTAVPAAAV